jgi:predicted PurR-regulated permease PerM
MWLLVAVAIVAWLARGVIGPFVVGALIAYAFSPLVSAAERRTRWPRIAIVAVGYLGAILVLIGLVLLLAERAVTELASLQAAGPGAIDTLFRQLVGGDAIDLAGQHVTVSSITRGLQEQVAAIFASPGDAVHIATRIGEFGLDALLTLIVSFYLILDGARFRDRTLALLPEQHLERTVGLLDRIHGVLATWLRGQLLLIALVAAVVYVVLGPLLHLPYALAIALLTGVLEVLPLVGPAIATGIAGVDAFVNGGVGLAVGIVVFYFVLRQIEDQVVMPIVIGRAVHLHPVVTIFAVLVGLSTFGVLGGLLGVPVAAAANVIFADLYPVTDRTPPTA